jgi:hypothetical protein
MTTQVLRKPNGSVIAVIQTSPNGWQWIKTINGVSLGYYRPESNGTFLPNGSFVGWGNLLGMLV